MFSRAQKSARTRKEPEKYKNFEATGMGKGKQRERQQSKRGTEGVKKRGGKK